MNGASSHARHPERPGTRNFQVSGKIASSISGLGFANPKPEIRTSVCWKFTIPVRVPPPLLFWGVAKGPQVHPKFEVGCGSHLPEHGLIWGGPNLSQFPGNNRSAGRRVPLIDCSLCTTGTFWGPEIRMLKLENLAVQVCNPKPENFRFKPET